MIRVPMPLAPPGASDKVRADMYRRHVEVIVALNPTYFLPLGVAKRWYHLFMLEHPLTKWEKR